MKQSIHRTIAELKHTNQDFEWYPTTEEIISEVKSNISGEYASVLDIGAGDGRVLEKLTEGKRYAIEKSRPLLDRLDKSIFIIGTDFYQQSLIDKKSEIIFCNPPYKEYEAWAEKILTEANAEQIFFVIPSRWKESSRILNAIEHRNWRHLSHGEFTFENADRQARCVVNIIQFFKPSGYESTDPFELWFDKEFPLDVKTSKYHSKTPSFEFSDNEIKEGVKNELINNRGDIVTALETFYHQEMNKLYSTYKSLLNVDADLLDELHVSKDGLVEALKKRVKGCKYKYWGELFENMKKVTDRLTSKYRSQLLDTLLRNTHVDFSAKNAHAVLTWVVKNANTYMDEQLVSLMESMTAKANIKKYVSNQRTFSEEEWRYVRYPKGLDRYSLDLRIVVTSMGGLHCDWPNTHLTLHNTSRNFFDDLCTLANNLGFDTRETKRSDDFNWIGDRGKKVFEYVDKDGVQRPLFEAKAFQNGNVHVKFAPKFIMKLNVEFGRINGWLKSKEQAAEELDISLKDVTTAFCSNFQIEHTDNILKLTDGLLDAA